MAQPNNSLPHFYGQRIQEEPIVESPMSPDHEKLQDGSNGALVEANPMSNNNNNRVSAESRQELLRLPAQPNPAHIDLSMEPEPPAVPMHQHQSSGVGLTPQKTTSIRKFGGQSESNEWISPNRPRNPGHQQQQSQTSDFRTSQSFNSPPSRRPGYVEDYSEEDDDPRMYHRRTTRRSQRPPASYNNYVEQNSRYGPIPRNSVNYDSNMHPAYADTPGKPNYEMYYPNEEQYPRFRAGGGGARGPPRGPPPESVMRLPWAVWMGSNAKNHFVAFVGEFVGTTMFLFFAFSGTQVANVGSEAAPTSNTTTGESAGFDPNVLLYISVVFAFSLMVNVWVFFRISGGLFNPAVTFAMLLCRALSPIRAFLLLSAQISGSIFASFLVSVLFPTNFNVRTTLGEGTSLAQGVWIEAILTAELVFTIFMLAKEKHKATFIAPVGIGLALFIAELVGVYYTGGSLNPARSFGPCVVTGVFDMEHWIYWVGPALGAIIAVVFYQFIKILEYEVANPGQDDNDKDQEVKEMRGREQSPDLEMGNAAGGGAPSIGGHSGRAYTLKDVMVQKAKKWEGQGFGGRGADTY